MRELAEMSTKDLHIWRGLLSSCSSRGVLLSWVFWQGGSVAAGETTRAGNFETSNPLTKCQKSTQRGAGVSVVLPSYFGTIFQYETPSTIQNCRLNCSIILVYPTCDHLCFKLIFFLQNPKLNQEVDFRL